MPRRHEKRFELMYVAVPEYVYVFDLGERVGRASMRAHVAEHSGSRRLSSSFGSPVRCLLWEA